MEEQQTKELLSDFIRRFKAFHGPYQVWRREEIQFLLDLITAQAKAIDDLRALVWQYENEEQGESFDPDPDLQ